MSASDAMENAVLLHYFNNSAHANVGDATGLPGSATAGSLFVSLHTADPGEAGTQATNETAYTGYARVTGSSAANTALLTFPTVGATGSTVTHFGIGVASTGATQLLFSGALAASRVLATSDIPQAAIGAITTAAD
jgi:hypothetical protein